MSKFIELKDFDTYEKILVNTSLILSVQRKETDYSVIKVVHSGGVQSLSCRDNYEDIKSKLCGAEQ